jgi:glutathione S-transferase
MHWQGDCFASLGLLDRSLGIAKVQLARPAYLADDEFTLADIQFGQVLFRYLDITIDRREYPALRRYYNRLTARPEFQEHVMVSYDELRVT